MILNDFDYFVLSDYHSVNIFATFSYISRLFFLFCEFVSCKCTNERHQFT